MSRSDDHNHTVAEELAEMRNGNRLTVTLVPNPEQPKRKQMVTGNLRCVGRQMILKTDFGQEHELVTPTGRVLQEVVQVELVNYSAITVPWNTNGRR